jgi:hypothetical protein
MGTSQQRQFHSPIVTCGQRSIVGETDEVNVGDVYVRLECVIATEDAGVTGSGHL